LRIEEFKNQRYSLSDIVKSFMKNRSVTYRKGRRTLPLEGGGKRVGVKELRDVARAIRKGSPETEVFSNIEGI